jgi:hypothetical protein
MSCYDLHGAALHYLAGLVAGTLSFVQLRRL